MLFKTAVFLNTSARERFGLEVYPFIFMHGRGRVLPVLGQRWQELCIHTGIAVLSDRPLQPNGANRKAASRAVNALILRGCFRTERGEKELRRGSLVRRLDNDNRQAGT